jgi:hypothetical protein
VDDCLKIVQVLNLRWRTIQIHPMV